MLVCDRVVWSLTGPLFDNNKYDYCTGFMEAVQFPTGSEFFAVVVWAISMTRANARMEIEW